MFRAFLVTWLTESVVAACFLRRVRWSRVLANELLLNLLTHPLLWLTVLYLDAPYLPKLFAAEAVAFAVETLAGLRLYRGSASRRRIAAAIIMANAVTLSMTFLL